MHFRCVCVCMCACVDVCLRACVDVFCVHVRTLVNVHMCSRMCMACVCVLCTLACDYEHACAFMLAYLVSVCVLVHARVLEALFGYGMVLAR